MSGTTPLFRIRNVRTGIILPGDKYGHGFREFDTREDAEGWIAMQKPDLPFEDFEVVEVEDDS